MSFNHKRMSYTITVNQKSSLQKAILSLKIKKSLNTLNKGTDNHLSEPTNREDGFAMAINSQTAVSMLRTIHKQRKGKAGTLLGNLLISTLPPYIECNVGEPSLSDSGFQGFVAEALLSNDNLMCTVSFIKHIHMYMYVHTLTHTGTQACTKYAQTQFLSR